MNIIYKKINKICNKTLTFLSCNSLNNRDLKKFIAHNERIFSKEFNLDCIKKPVILFELNFARSNLIAYSYLSVELQKKHKANLVGYSPRVGASFIYYLIFKVKQILGMREFGAYSSFGFSSFMVVRANQSQKKRADSTYSEIIRAINDKWDIENITINRCRIGDLIYDSYLRINSKPTIDKSSKDFHIFLKNFIEYFVVWEDYFNNNDVQAVNVSHCVYHFALPLRLAVARNIPAYQANVTHIYRLNDDCKFAYNDFYKFPELFLSLSDDLKKIGLENAKKRIERRFAGEIGVDMSYSTKSAYTNTTRYKLLLAKSAKKKILIAAHCFFDSPHSYGDNIFPDFYEWIDFLGNISEYTDYDWYIKTHPDSLPGNKKIINHFVDKYKKFSLLPSDASHHQIVAEGIDVALTVYGTIGFEYAALGVPVINCSVNNPHVAYDFNYHPKNINEYKNLLLNLDQLSLSIEKKKVYEYYFMRNIFHTENIFFNNYRSMCRDLGGYSEQFTDAVFGIWLSEWTLEKHQAITSAINNFVSSGEQRLDYRHFGRKLTANSLGLI